MAFWPDSGETRRKAAVLIAAAAILAIVIVWECYAGLAGADTRSITWERVVFRVPRNFPAGKSVTNGGLRIMSFNVLSHDTAGKYTHFFEVISTAKKIDWQTRLPGNNYSLGRSKKEDFTAGNRRVVLITTGVTISYPCGISQKTNVLTAQFYCPENKRYITFISFTTNRDTFVEILESVSCS